MGGGGADDFEDSDDDDEPSEPVEEVEAPKAPRQSALKARKSSAMSKKKDPLRMAAKSKAVADLEHCTVTRYGWVKRVAAAVCAGGNVPKAAATQHSSDLSPPTPRIQAQRPLPCLPLMTRRPLCRFCDPAVGSSGRLAGPGSR